MNSFKKIMSKYGRDVSLHTSDGWTSGVYSAFLQPLRYKNKMYLEGINTEIGSTEQGYYLYIGPADHNLKSLPYDAWIKDFEGNKYHISKAEKVFLGNDELYIWAIIKSIEEENYGQSA